MPVVNKQEKKFNLDFGEFMSPAFFLASAIAAIWVLYSLYPVFNGTVAMSKTPETTKIVTKVWQASDSFPFGTIYYASTKDGLLLQLKAEEFGQVNVGSQICTQGKMLVSITPCK